MSSVKESHRSAPPRVGNPSVGAVHGHDEADSGKIVHEVDTEMKTKTQQKLILSGVYVLLVLLGIGTGFMLTRGSNSATGSSASFRPSVVSTDKTKGSTDTKTFKDSAVGVIEKGGQDGEGTHKLIRDGGPSQTAYLISSVVDLDEFLGKKVKVWGQTVGAKKVAWLLDVGRVEVQ